MNQRTPRPEYPRPQMVRQDWLNLNGAWEFELDSGRSGEARGLHQGVAFSRQITVPFCPESPLSGVGEKDFMPCVWYRRLCALPATWKGKRVLLHFGAVDYDTTVWVNGERAGTHRGGYSSFSFEITALLKEGENVIAVCAVDDTRSPLQPSGKQSMQYHSYACLYTRTTGIWQTVWLEAVSQAYLHSFRLYPDLDQGKLTVQARVEGAAEGMVLHCRALADGKLAGEVSLGAHGYLFFSLELARVRAWEPEDPFLYDLEFELEREGEEIDRVQSYFGLRKIHLEGAKVLINDRPLFQRLVLDQGFYPDGIYTAPSDEALKRDIELSMAMGFNGARLHEKVFESRFLYWADRLGYLVWGEYPNWGLDHAHPQALERVLGEWLEVVGRDFNHPAIVGWCPFNETPTSQNPELLRLVYRATKAADPTRPVIDTSGYVHVETDIYDCHSYEQNPEKFAALFAPFKEGGEVWRNFPQADAPHQGQPYFVSEYGGIWWNPWQEDQKAWGYGERPRTEEEFLARYQALTETLLSNPRMFGFCYTQLTDVEQEVNGLYTYDRRPKFDPETIRRINSQPAASESE
ncbi:MAG: beta-galactosidase [Candidatus Handelsmanbacteria bacterium]|nr:beta-galactosidase [Candidatus Handelsmanbacteria bacterium]